MNQYSLPLEIYNFIRIGYGILIAFQFLLMIPYGKVYFTSVKYGGIVPSNKLSDLILSPVGYWILTFYWMFSSVAISLNYSPVVFLGINFCLSYMFFIHLRWATPMRGMGAPGYITHWLTSFVLLTELALNFGDKQLHLYNLVNFMFRWDFAIMMLDSGVNKIFHGYPQNKGMNFGMANPAWGYWPNIFKKLPADHPLFKFCNYNAIALQILGASLLLFPATYLYGAIIMAFSFVVVHCLIRLGVLCNLIILSTLIYMTRDSFVFKLIYNCPIPVAAYDPQTNNLLVSVLTLMLWTFIFLLPIIKIGMYFNFYAKKRLPGVLQSFLEFYTNKLGIIIWRVFTIELIDYFIKIYFEDRATKKRTLYTRFGHRQLFGNNRFLWVGESIMSVIIFNSMRYFPQSDLFQTRLNVYTKTFPTPANCDTIYEWITLSTKGNQFSYVPTREFRVDSKECCIHETLINSEVWEEQKSRGFAMHATNKPGTYAPAQKK